MFKIGTVDWWIKMYFYFNWEHKIIWIEIWKEYIICLYKRFCKKWKERKVFRLILELEIIEINKKNFRWKLNCCPDYNINLKIKTKIIRIKKYLLVRELTFALKENQIEKNLLIQDLTKDLKKLSKN